MATGVLVIQSKHLADQDSEATWMRETVLVFGLGDSGRIKIFGNSVRLDLMIAKEAMD